MLYPLKTVPVYKNYLWGGNNLKKLGKSVPEEPVAESWELSAMPGNENRIANGPLKGENLAELIEKYGKLITGDKTAHNSPDAGLPVLLKFIDANDRLSIQVHPDDEYARKHENGKSGKTEMWYVLDAKPGSTVVHGFREGLEQKQIKGFIKERKYKDLFREVTVEKGDVIFVQAGTVHALNGGLVVAEIQQPSDLTYRIYDYDRVDAAGKQRPLHIEKALDVLDYRTYKAVYRGLAIRDDKFAGKYLALNRNFCVRQIESAGDPIELVADGTLSAWMILSGEAEVSSKIERVCAKALETVLIPAFLGRYRMEGKFSALQIFPAENVINEYYSLLDQGYSSDEVAQSVAGAEHLCSTFQIAV